VGGGAVDVGGGGDVRVAVGGVVEVGGGGDVRVGVGGKVGGVVAVGVGGTAVRVAVGDEVVVAWTAAPREVSRVWALLKRALTDSV
jgi:hypothetical protein